MATIREQKKITQFYDFPPNVQLIKVTIPSAEVLTLFDTPVEVVPAEEGVAYQALLPSGGPEVYGTTPYATNTDLVVTTDGADVPHANGTDILESSVARTVVISPAFVTGTTNTQIVPNAALTVTVKGGNPTDGDSDIVLYIPYLKISVS